MVKPFRFWSAYTGADPFSYEAHMGLEEWELIQKAIMIATNPGSIPPLNDADRGLLADIVADMEANDE